MATPGNKLTPDANRDAASNAASPGATSPSTKPDANAAGNSVPLSAATDRASGNDRAGSTSASNRAVTDSAAASPPAGRATATGAYKVQIPLYEGPLDLLLDLIKQQKMSVHDIQISKITSQYLEYLHQLEELNVDVSAEFIYMAATLIYIKSKMLLPPDPLATEEELAADPRAELVQRLVEHEKFKNAAQLLYQKQQIEEHVWSKPDKSLYHDEGTEGELVVSLVDLVKVFQQVLERRKEVSRIELQHEEFTVAQMIAQVRAQILASETNAIQLIQFFEACASRHAMIVAFLAVLEMVKLQAVALVQEKQFGEILIRKSKAFDTIFDERGEIRAIDEEYK